MFCRKCGEENPEEAVYCKNCGAKLIEEIKKPEVIETTTNRNTNQNTNQKSTTSTSSSTSDSSWIGCCCLGLIVVFILSALFGGV